MVPCLLRQLALLLGIPLATTLGSSSSKRWWLRRRGATLETRELTRLKSIGAFDPRNVVYASCRRRPIVLLL